MNKAPRRQLFLRSISSAIMSLVWTASAHSQDLCPTTDHAARIIITLPGVLHRVAIPREARFAYVIGIAGGGGGGSSQVNGADGGDTTVNGIVIARGAPGASGLRLEGAAGVVTAGGTGSQASPPEAQPNSAPRSAESGQAVQSDASPLIAAGIKLPGVIPGGPPAVDAEPFRRGDGGGGGSSSCGLGGTGGSVTSPAGQAPTRSAYGAGGGGGYSNDRSHEAGSGGFGSVAQARLLDLTGISNLLVRVGPGGRGAPEIPHVLAASGSGAGGYALIFFLSGPIEPGAVEPLKAPSDKKAEGGQ